MAMEIGARMLISTPLAVAFSTFDCLEMHRWFKILVAILGLANYSYGYFGQRFLATHWPEDVLFGIPGLKLKPLWLSATQQMCVFIAKGIISCVHGNRFAFVRPRFIDAEPAMLNLGYDAGVLACAHEAKDVYSVSDADLDTCASQAVIGTCQEQWQKSNVEEQCIHVEVQTQGFPGMEGLLPEVAEEVVPEATLLPQIGLAMADVSKLISEIKLSRPL